MTPLSIGLMVTFVLEVPVHLSRLPDGVQAALKSLIKTVAHQLRCNMEVANSPLTNGWTREFLHPTM